MTAKDPRVVFHNNPWPMALPSGIFALVGAFFVALGVQELGRGSARLPAMIALALGAIALAFGAHLIQQAERVTVTFDRETRLVVLDGRLFWRRRREQWRFDEVETVVVEQWDDSDGPLWRAYMMTKSGARVHLMANWDNDRDAVTAACARARAVLAGSRDSHTPD